MNNAIEQVAFLAQSSCRFQILRYLLEHDNAEKRSLKTVVDGSRTTLQRNLNALEEQGWISSVGTSISITPVGRLVAEAFLPLVEAVSVATELSEFFEWIPETELDFDLRALADSSVTVAQDGNPYAAIDQHVSAIEASSTIRLLLPVVGLHPMQVATTRLRDDELTAKCIVTSDGANVLRTDARFRAELRTHLETGNIEYYVLRESVPFFLGIYDHYVQIGVGDSDGVPRALIETQSDEVREWATSTYRQYKHRAESFPPVDGLPA